ncbi:unnamed protein product, partial [Urochloa humidicola]
EWRCESSPSATRLLLTRVPIINPRKWRSPSSTSYVHPPIAAPLPCSCSYPGHGPALSSWWRSFCCRICCWTFWSSGAGTSVDARATFSSIMDVVQLFEFLFSVSTRAYV